MTAEKAPFASFDSQFQDNATVGFEISMESYTLFQRFLSSECGIRLGDNKRYLVANRLAGVCRNAGMRSLDQLINKLTAGSLSQSVVTEIVDAMTTNETFWFRDAAQFLELNDVILPELAGNRNLTVRIWSAGCSSGQEPYSISIAIDKYNRNHASNALTKVQILATDVSESILKRAISTQFSEFELCRGLDIESRSRYFSACHGGWGLDSKISSRVHFRALNLRKPYATLGHFELIFCRNVLIYFPDDLKRDILTRMARSLNPGGYLFLSSTETLPSDLGFFELVKGRPVRYFRRA